MNTALVAQLIAQYGIPGAIAIINILKSGTEFTPEMEQRLLALGLRHASDYERAPQA